MRRLRRALMFTVVTSFASCLTGCIVISHHSIAPVEVLVLDAESGAPLSDATVSIDYIHPEAIVLNMPKEVSADTGTEGRVTLGVADFKWGRVWTVSATGYASVRWDEDGRHPTYWPVPVGVRDMFNEEQARREIAVHLYRGPPPKITVVIPNGYRGPLKIELRPSENYVQGEVGQREFVFNTSETGYVGIEATPLLQRSWSNVSRWHVRYAGGTRIRRRTEYYLPDADERIALRRIVSRGNRYLYMIGTKADAEALRAEVFEKVTDPDHSRPVNQRAFDAIFSQ